MDSELLGKAVQYHGPDLIRLLQTEQQNIPDNAIDYLPKFRDNNDGFCREVKHNIQRFISKKADILFKPADEHAPTLNSQDSTEEDLYAKMPPIESFMGVENQACRQHFYNSLEKYDVVVGIVTQVLDSGLVLSLLCMDNGKARDINEFRISAFCPAKELPRLPHQSPTEGFTEKDKVRGVVINVNPETERIIVSLLEKSLSEENPQIKLGLINEDEFPVQYRRKLHIRGLTFDELLHSILGFNNCGNVPALLKILNLPENTSFLRGLHGIKIPEKEFAENLRKSQSQKWAHQSVAEGIRLFKVGRQMEAIQHLNKALQIDPTNVEAFVARGALYANNESYHKAIDDFEEALSVNPRHQNARKYMFETLLALAKVCEEQDNYDDAEYHIRRALSVQPESVEAREALRFLFYRKDKRDRGERRRESSPILIEDEGSPEQGSYIDKTALALKKLIDEDKDKQRKAKKRKRSSHGSLSPGASKSKKSSVSPHHRHRDSLDFSEKYQNEKRSTNSDSTRSFWENIQKGDHSHFNPKSLNFDESPSSQYRVDKQASFLSHSDGGRSLEEEFRNLKQKSPSSDGRGAERLYEECKKFEECGKDVQDYALASAWMDRGNLDKEFKYRRNDTDKFENRGSENMKSHKSNNNSKKEQLIKAEKRKSPKARRGSSFPEHLVSSGRGKSYKASVEKNQNCSRDRGRQKRDSSASSTESEHKLGSKKTDRGYASKDIRGRTRDRSSSRSSSSSSSSTGSSDSSSGSSRQSREPSPGGSRQRKEYSRGRSPSQKLVQLSSKAKRSDDPERSAAKGGKTSKERDSVREREEARSYSSDGRRGSSGKIEKEKAKDLEGKRENTRKRSPGSKISTVEGSPKGSESRREARKEEGGSISRSSGNRAGSVKEISDRKRSSTEDIHRSSENRRTVKEESESRPRDSDDKSGSARERDDAKYRNSDRERSSVEKREEARSMGRQSFEGRRETRPGSADGKGSAKSVTRTDDHLKKGSDSSKELTEDKTALDKSKSRSSDPRDDATARSKDSRKYNEVDKQNDRVGDLMVRRKDMKTEPGRRAENVDDGPMRKMSDNTSEGKQDVRKVVKKESRTQEDAKKGDTSLDIVKSKWDSPGDDRYYTDLGMGRATQRKSRFNVEDKGDEFANQKKTLRESHERKSSSKIQSQSPWQHTARKQPLGDKGFHQVEKDEKDRMSLGTEKSWKSPPRTEKEERTRVRNEYPDLGLQVRVQSSPPGSNVREGPREVPLDLDRESEGIRIHIKNDKYLSDVSRSDNYGDPASIISAIHRESGPSAYDSGRGMDSGIRAHDISRNIGRGLDSGRDMDSSRGRSDYVDRGIDDRKDDSSKGNRIYITVDHDGRVPQSDQAQQSEEQRRLHETESDRNMRKSDRHGNSDIGHREPDLKNKRSNVSWSQDSRSAGSSGSRNLPDVVQSAKVSSTSHSSTSRGERVHTSKGHRSDHVPNRHSSGEAQRGRKRSMSRSSSSSSSSSSPSSDRGRRKMISRDHNSKSQRRQTLPRYGDPRGNRGEKSAMESSRRRFLDQYYRSRERRPVRERSRTPPFKTQSKKTRRSESFSPPIGRSGAFYVKTKSQSSMSAQSSSANLKSSGQQKDNEKILSVVNESKAKIEASLNEMENFLSELKQKKKHMSSNS